MSDTSNEIDILNAISTLPKLIRPLTMSQQINKCHICHTIEEPDDAVIECNKCNVKLHPRCYMLGLPTIPDIWLCEVCSTGTEPKSVPCELCHKSKNIPSKVAFKHNSTDSNQYVHVMCANDKSTWENMGYVKVYYNSDTDRLYTYDIKNIRRVIKQPIPDISMATNGDIIDITDEIDSDNNVKRRKTEHTNDAKQTPTHNNTPQHKHNNNTSNGKHSTSKKHKFVDNDTESDTENSKVRPSPTKQKLLQLEQDKQLKQQQQKEHQRFKAELAKFESLEYADRYEVLKNKTVADIQKYDDYQAVIDDTSDRCEICGLKYIRDDSAPDCQFIICGSDDAHAKQGCDSTVHNYCNGGPFPVTEDDWYCDSCTANVDASTIICAICEQGGRPDNVGSFKRVANYKQLQKTLKLKSEWAHTVCAMYIRGCWVDLNDRHAPVHGIEDINVKDKRICSICHNKGATVLCCESNCMTAFHPSCACYTGLQLENITLQDDEANTTTDNRVIFCKKHCLADRIERRVRDALKLPLPKCLQRPVSKLAHITSAKKTNDSTEYVTDSDVVERRKLKKKQATNGNTSLYAMQQSLVETDSSSDSGSDSGSESQLSDHNDTQTNTTTNKQKKHKQRKKPFVPTPTENDNNETVRQQFVSAILKALKDEDAKIVAKQIEKHIFTKYPTDYRNKCRDIIYALNQNKQLREQLIDGTLSAVQLIAMNYKDTADDSTKQQREAAAAESLKERQIEAMKPRRRFESSQGNTDNIDIVVQPVSRISSDEIQKSPIEVTDDMPALENEQIHSDEIVEFSS